MPLASSAHSLRPVDSRGLALGYGQTSSNAGSSARASAAPQMRALSLGARQPSSSGSRRPVPSDVTGRPNRASQQRQDAMRPPVLPVSRDRTGQRRGRQRASRGDDSDSDDFMGDLPRAPPEEPDDAWDFFERLEGNARQCASDVASQLHAVPWNSEDGFGSECAICLADFQKGDQVSKLRCGHGFHVDCVARWLSTRARCPLCRAATCSPRAGSSLAGGSG